MSRPEGAARGELTSIDNPVDHLHFEHYSARTQLRREGLVRVVQRRRLRANQQSRRHLAFVVVEEERGDRLLAKLFLISRD